MQNCREFNVYFNGRQGGTRRDVLKRWTLIQESLMSTMCERQCDLNPRVSKQIVCVCVSLFSFGQ